MPTETVLSVIARKRLANQYEPVATDALLHIVNESAIAASVLAQVISETGVSLPEATSYEPPAGDGGTPDIAVLAKDGTLLSFVENKFWAGLTENQPVAYLNKLGGKGVILFIVPEARVEIIWRELQSRCVQAGMAIGAIEKKGAVGFTVLPNDQRLAVISWRTLLERMQAALSQHGELNVVCDVEQLQGLCEVMDSEAFLPLRADELSNQVTPRRVLNFIGLADDIAQRAKSQGICTELRENLGYNTGAVGRTFHLAHYKVQLLADPSLWNRYGLSPVWVWFFDKTKSAEIQHRLRAEGSPFRDRCFVEPQWSQVVTPILLLSAVVKDAIVEDAVRQLAELRDMLS